MYSTDLVVVSGHGLCCLELTVPPVRRWSKKNNQSKKHLEWSRHFFLLPCSIRQRIGQAGREEREELRCRNPVAHRECGKKWALAGRCPNQQSFSRGAGLSAPFLHAMSWATCGDLYRKYWCWLGTLYAKYGARQGRVRLC